MSEHDEVVALLEQVQEGLDAATRSAEDATLVVLERLELISRALHQAEAGAQAQALVGPLARVAIAAEEAVIALQAHDIVNQQLVHAAFTVQQAVAKLTDPSLAVAHVEAPNADGNATMHDRAGRQALADDIFG